MSKKNILPLFFRMIVLSVSLLIFSLLDRTIGFHLIFLFGVFLLIDHLDVGSFLVLVGFSLVHDVMYVLPLGITGLIIFVIMVVRSEKKLRMLPSWAEAGVWSIIGSIIISVTELYV